ncbi:MAG: NAD-dependent epimerase/dehydratase family protein [Chitinophagales bacterium]
MILVTGATGFLGTHLLQALLQNQNLPIRALKRSSSQLDLLGELAHKVDWYDTDLRDARGVYAAMEGVEQVYHCAAVVSFNPKEAELMKTVNVEGTANVVNAALEQGIQKMVYVSSIAAIGRSEKSNQVSEKTKWEDSPMNTKYAISKMLAEREVWRAYAEGLPVVMVNPSVIIGEGTWTSDSSRLFTEVWKGLKFYPVGGTGYVDVKDVARAMVLLMDSAIVGERFILNGANITYLDFFSQVAKHLGKPAPSIKATAWMADLAWRLEAVKSFFTRQNPVITKETARMAQRQYFYESQKIENQLDFSFTPMDTSIQRIAKAFLNAHQD